MVEELTVITRPRLAREQSMRAKLCNINVVQSIQYFLVITTKLIK